MISFLVWLFDFIPNFVIYGILIFSIVVLLIYRFLPIGLLKKQYIKLAAVGLFIISLYATGMIAVINDYKDKIKEFEIKVAVAEEQSSKANREIKYVYVDKKVKLQENTKITEQNIEKQKEIINKSCKITPNMIQLHNQGVRREK